MMYTKKITEIAEHRECFLPKDLFKISENLFGSR